MEHAMESIPSPWIAGAGLAAGLAAVLAAAPAGAQPAKPAQPVPVIDIVHMGGDDCPPCVEWRKTELPKLQAAPEFKAIRFTHVTKSITSAVPPQLFFPAEVKHLQPALKEASGGISGSPQQAILVDGKVVDYWFGGGKGEAAELTKMVQAIQGGKPFPRPTCQQLKTSRVCLKAGPTRVS
jgi:hypothetical protein